MAPPTPLTLIDERTAADTTGVVDQDVEATEFGIGTRDGRSHLFGVHHISLHRKDLAVALTNQVGGLFCALRIDLGEDDIRAGLGKRQRDAAADPSAATGDHGNPPGQIYRGSTHESRLSYR